MKKRSEIEIMKQLYDSEEEAVAVEDLIDRVIEARRERTMQEIFHKLSEQDKITLQERVGMT